MRVVWQWVWKQIFSGVVADGYDDVNPAHVGMFRYPTLDRKRPSDLADQLQITKQSVNDLLGHLEQHGYLTRELDPSDRRARVVRLTRKGQRLEKIVNGLAKAAEIQIAEVVGPRCFSQLRNALEELADHITQNDPPSARPTNANGSVELIQSSRRTVTRA